MKNKVKVVKSRFKVKPNYPAKNCKKWGPFRPQLKRLSWGLTRWHIQRKMCANNANCWSFLNKRAKILNTARYEGTHFMKKIQKFLSKRGSINLGALFQLFAKMVCNPNLVVFLRMARFLILMERPMSNAFETILE